MVWVLVLLLLFILWNSREGFTVPSVVAGVKEPSIDDPTLVATITAAMPTGSKIATYIAILKDYYNTVFSDTKTTPSTWEIQTYLFQQPISSADRSALTNIMPDIFATTVISDSPQEFVPEKTLIQPSMAAEPVKENAKPGTYETSDKDPVMPKSKVMTQRSSLERGDGPNVAAYTWNLAAYQQDTVQSVPGAKPNPYIPKLPGAVEHMSTMAGGITHTNEIYGPRVPKMAPAATSPDVSAFDSRIYPNLYSPTGVRRKHGHRTDTGMFGTGTGVGTDTGMFGTGTGAGTDTGMFGTGTGAGTGIPTRGDLAVATSTPDYVPISGMKIPDNIPKTEPVPFLNDFSKFYR